MDELETVLAMRIDDLTYAYYLALPAEHHYPISEMRGNWIILRDGGWSWSDHESFTIIYKRIEAGDPNRFTRYVLT